MRSAYNAVSTRTGVPTLQSFTSMLSPQSKVATELPDMTMFSACQVFPRSFCTAACSVASAVSVEQGAKTPSIVVSPITPCSGRTKSASDHSTGKARLFPAASSSAAVTAGAMESELTISPATTPTAVPTFGNRECIPGTPFLALAEPI